MIPSQPSSEFDDHLIAVVVPAYRVTDHILDVLAKMPEEVWRIYVVDDACPDGSGDLVLQQCDDSRLSVIKLTNNLGVGGAVMAGYQAAIDAGAVWVARQGIRLAPAGYVRCSGVHLGGRKSGCSPRT